MYTGVKNLRAAFIIGALSLSLYTPKTHAEGEALFGLAAITGAASTMVVPSIMASRDVAIANINAGVSTYIAGLSASTQAYAIGASTRQSMFNTLTTMRIASLNTQKELAQTYLTTAFQAWDRNQFYQLERERLAQDNYFRNRRLNLELLAARAQQELNQVQFNTNLMAQGLSNGFKRVSSLSTQNVIAGSPALSLVPSTAAVTPGNWIAPLSLRPRASTLATAFRGLASLAGGSSSERRIKSDIGRFMDVKSNPYSEYALRHQTKELSSVNGSTHEGSFRALRNRPRPESSPVF